MLAQASGLSQLSLSSLNAVHLMERFRELEQQWVFLFRAHSELQIFGEAELLRSLTESLRIDGLLGRVLARLLTEHEANVAYGPPGGLSKVLRTESFISGGVDIAPSDAQMGAAASGSNLSRSVVKQFRASAKESETVTVRKSYPISRAEARDHFGAIADHAGGRCAWDQQVANTTNAKRLERVLPSAPTPGLRRFWSEASAAGKVMDQLRMTEKEWSGLLEAKADLPLVHQDRLISPLIEFLGIDKRLARVFARTAIENRQSVEPRSKLDTHSQRLAVKPPDPGKVNNSSSLPIVHLETNPAAETIHKADRGSSAPKTQLEIASRKHSAAAPARENATITRAKARAHFNEIADRAGLRSSWHERVITTTGTSETTPTLSMPGFASEAAAVPIPQVLNPAPAIKPISDKSERGVNHRDSPAREFSYPESHSASSLSTPLILNSVTFPSTSRMVEFESAINNPQVSEERMDQVLRPLVETIHASQRLARNKLASGEKRLGSNRSSEIDVAPFISEVPLTGLRRLAEMAANTGEERAIKSDVQEIPGDRGTTYRAHGPSMAPHVATVNQTDFASQLAEYLRSEVLRHGIRLENN